MDYGPWQPMSVLYDKHGTTILETHDRQWVLKVSTSNRRSMYELRILLELIANKPRHSIYVPIQPYYLYGRTPTAGWYAMKRYTGEVCLNDFCQANWRILAVHVLQFLQDFHHLHRLVHMDIKKGNILYDLAAINFVAADYEHAEVPGSAHTSDSEDDYKWYYIAMGAELDQPLYSWRLDLVALGYVLGSLTMEPQAWTFEQICWDKRTKPGSLTDAEAIYQRNKEIADITEPQIKAYLALVATIAWDSKDPPPRSFYEELEAIFKTPCT